MGLLTGRAVRAHPALQAERWAACAARRAGAGAGVSTWLSYLLGVPYWVMAGSLLVGQAICGVAGVLLVKGLKRGWLKEKQ